MAGNPISSIDVEETLAAQHRCLRCGLSVHLYGQSKTIVVTVFPHEGEKRFCSVKCAEDYHLSRAWELLIHIEGIFGIKQKDLIKQLERFKLAKTISNDEL